MHVSPYVDGEVLLPDTEGLVAVSDEKHGG